FPVCLLRLTRQVAHRRLAERELFIRKRAPEQGCQALLPTARRIERASSHKVVSPERLFARKVPLPYLFDPGEVRRDSFEVEATVVAGDPVDQFPPHRTQPRLPHRTDKLFSSQRQLIRFSFQQSRRPRRRGEEAPEAVRFLVTENLTVPLRRQGHDRTRSKTGAYATYAREPPIAGAEPRIGRQLLPAEERPEAVSSGLVRGAPPGICKQPEANDDGLEVFDGGRNGRQIADDPASEPGPDGHRPQWVDGALHMGTRVEFGQKRTSEHHTSAGESGVMVVTDVSVACILLDGRDRTGHSSCVELPFLPHHSHRLLPARIHRRAGVFSTLRHVRHKSYVRQ